MATFFKPIFFSLLTFSISVFSISAFSFVPNDNLPGWVQRVGARTKPTKTRTLLANERGAKGDGKTNSTAAIQRSIDDCSRAGGGIVSFEKGEYVTGAIFLKNNVNLLIDAGVTLLGSQDEDDYPRLPTRVAGIEMTWPAALINVNDAKNVEISGEGTIDGRGQKWWDKYWALRKVYEPKGLRWASDYDAERVRLMVVMRSANVTIANLSLKRAGFWTVQIVYSDHVTVDGIKISDNGGPSTDGVDIDSSAYVLVEHCDIDNNDDDICLKSGRDFDGLRVNRPTEYVVIRNNMIRRGGGVVAFGSETSGGIRHIVAIDNRGVGTKEGIRFKSAKTRGGYVRDVLIRGLTLENVPMPITFTLNWNPSYSYAAIPADIKEVPAYWKIMNTPVLPAERGYCDFRDIRIENVHITGATRIFSASGLPDKPIVNVAFANLKAEGKEAGSIEYGENWTMKNVDLVTAKGEPLSILHSKNVANPRVSPK